MAHRIVKRQPEHAHEEVNGVAGEVALGPAPVAVFDDEAGIGGQNEITGLAGDQLESALLQKPNQWGESGVADLLACPPLALMRWVGHLSLPRLRQDVAVLPPVGLDEHAVDLLEVNDTDLIAHRLNQ